MKEKIKLLVITHSFPTKNNPVAAIFLLNQLKELKKYCEIKIIYPYAYVPKIKIFNPYYRFSKVPSKERVGGIEVYHPKYIMIPRMLFKLKLLHFYLAIESFFSYFASKKITDRIVESWNPDIIHLHGSLSESLLGKRLKRKYKKPMLVTAYGDDINRYLKQIPSSFLVKSALKSSNAIICQSRFLQNEIGKRISGKKLFIIPMGALLDKFKPKGKNKARKVLGLPKDKKIILFIGHLFERKGVEYLISALRLVLKKDKNILCCIIGSGHSEDKLKKIASDLDLDNHIKFLGQKTHDEIVPYMNACDIFVLPSLSEGLPVVLCEALAAGKPVVATKVAGTPEIVTKNVGFLVRPKDSNDLSEKIILALNKRWDKKKLLRRSKEFSVANSAKKLVNVYNSFLRKDI